MEAQTPPPPHVGGHGSGTHSANRCLENSRPRTTSHPGRCRLWLALAFAFLVTAGGAQEIVIPNGATWRWRPGTNEVSTPFTAWRTNGFNDTAWLSGPAPFSYGNNASGRDDGVTTGTVVSNMINNFSCIFLRRAFVITNVAEIQSVALNTTYDDGFVAWINGVPVLQQNMPTNSPAHTNFALVAHEADPGVLLTVGGSPQSYLVAGTNVLAVQLFNNQIASSDLRFETTLQVSSGTMINPPVITGVAPAPDATLGALTQITVTFSQPVYGVDPVDLRINDQPASAVSGLPGTNRFTFTFTQPPPGLVALSWFDAADIVDLAGTPFDPAGTNATWSYTLLDNVLPVVSELTPVAGALVSQLTQVEVRFSEPVSGVDASDLLVRGVPATTVSGAEAGPYLFTFASPAAGSVNFTWATTTGIMDLASNTFAGGGWSVTLNPALAPGDVLINEFVAGNRSGLTDEDGDPEDWIEIFNQGTTTVNLLGWSLAGDADVPGKWTFPATNLAPGQYLVVFASGKDRRSPGAPLHTNFKLDAFGEYLALFNAESPRVAVSAFDPEYPEQRNDYSYGRDATNAWRYFATPTPGAANGGSAIVGIAPEPHFSVNRGVFDAPFNVLLTTPLAGATIRYTTDGSEPTESHGSVFTGPLTISQTTTLRAVTLCPGYLPSRTRTHSYFFLSQVMVQPANPPGFPATLGTRSGVGFPGNLVPADYEMDSDPLRVDPNDSGSALDPVKQQRLAAGLRELPIVSIVMDNETLFGATGLYSYPNVNNKNFPDQACSVEMILPDGATAFATACGLGVHGNASRLPEKSPKHGFKLAFKGEFGEGSLKYRLFPDSPATEFDDLILRPDYNASWLHPTDDSSGGGLGAYQRTRATRMRDAFVKDTRRAMGGLGSFNRYCHLFLNGLYWGTYDFSEQPSEKFAENYLSGPTNDYDIIEAGALSAGTLTAYNAMLAVSDLANNTNYELMKQYLDVTEFADYMLLNFWVGAQDWGNNKNWYTLRRRVSGPDGRFQYVPWDCENLLLDEGVNRVPNGGGSSDVPSGLFTKLDDNAQFRLDFADRVHKQMIAPGGALTRESLSARWRKWRDLLDAPIVAESCRWGDYRRDVHPYQTGAFVLYTRENQWLAEQDRMLNSYLVNRPGVVLGQLRAAGLYPALDAPEFREATVSGPILGGGAVGAGLVVAFKNPGGTGMLLCTTNGSDPRVYYSGQVAEGVLTNPAPLTLNGSVTLKARVFANGVWSALNEASFTVGELGLPLRLTEIMYNPPGGDPYEFLEVQNIGAQSLNLGGFSFQGLTYTFPGGTVLAPGAVLLLANGANPAQFATRYPGAVVFGYYSGSLDNGGERIAILDTNGRTVTAVHYDDAAGWPTAADGGGYSLEVIDPRGDPSAPANWRASASPNGTPGLPPVAPVPGNIVLNEIAADNAGSVANDGLFPDWIELFNRGGSQVNLANWSLTDDSGARKFVIPSGTSLAAGGYLVVWCDTATNAPGLHTGFSLSRTGETISLFDANTNRVDALTYGLQLTDLTVGRVGDLWQLTLPTPNTANVAAPVAATTNLVLNEWLASAGAGAADWLELFNRSASAPVALRGLYFGTSNALFAYNALSFVPPLGHVQLFADEEAGADQLEFKLPAAGGAITVFSPATALLDSITYGPQLPGISEGRLPDGAANITAFAGSISPGASNYVLNYSGPMLNEVLARNDRAAVSPWGDDADFVELYNPGGVAASLAGMALGDSSDPDNAWKFPAGASIPAGGYVVVWCDNTRAASTDASGPHNTGFSLAGNSGAVYLFNALGQPVDVVDYGFQVQDQPLGRTGAGWQLLTTATPGAVNAAAASLGSVANLQFNEWMAAPTAGADWFELFNPGPLPVDLGGRYLTDDPSTIGITNSPIAPLSFIGAGKWALFQADGVRSAGHDHVNFALDQLGGTLRLYDTNLALLAVRDYGVQSPGSSQGLLPDGAANLVSFPASATPGDANYLPIPGLVINEILTHTDPPLEDAVELFNPTANAVNLGGWFLSDSQSDLKRYRIPDGTTIPAGGFKVFYQYQFGPADGETDAPPLFTFNAAHGDGVYLSEADGAQNLTGYRLGQTFDAAANGVSLGRYPTSVGVDFVPLSARTFGVDQPGTVAEFRTGLGAANAAPLVGPVVISEIMYHPPAFGTNSPDDEEFIELMNLTSTNVALFDPAHVTNTWRLANAVSFNFATNQTLAAGARLLVVSFAPTNTGLLAAFRARYGTNGEIVGPFSGRLNNAGDTLELWRPDAPQTASHPDAGFVPQLLVERITYSDLPPWPTNADGFGDSLQRIEVTQYGNDPVNWKTAPPTAGTAPAGSPPPQIVAQPQSRAVFVGESATFTVTATGDGLLSYQWLSNNIPLAGQTATNLVLAPVTAAYAADYRVQVSNAGGTVLSDPATLAVNAPPTGGAALIGSAFARITFSVIAGRTYQLEYTDDLANPNWLPLGSPRFATDTTLITNDPLGPAQRFYRLAVLPPTP